jgi:ferredoxin-NADP reductase
LNKDREILAVVRAIQYVGRRYVVIEAVASEDMAHDPGQFTKVTFEDHEGTYGRFYSIASSTRPDRSFELCIILDDQRLRDLLANWQIGTSFHCSRPGGKFHVPAHDRNVVCVAGGSGVTPLRAIIEDRIKNHATAQTVLLYGCKCDDEIPFYESLEILSRRSSRLNLQFFAEESPLRRAPSGRPLDHLQTFILKDADYLLCGPPAFMEAAQRILTESGIAKDVIHRDRF